MKGNRSFFVFNTQKKSLHMKGNEGFFEVEKCFNFQKMDKKNVQILYAKTLLTDKKICLDV